ncbi:MULTISPECIES: MFS transporter [unclassified Nostoc]|uniref:MFS transporter n=1 Tax=unclassified Nostoc TaxID=2593658 RepID=UPI001D145348|nr:MULTISPECIES: MFS transporter [unclassified Nostoc]
MSTTTVRRKSSTFYVILIAGAAALGGFLFGFSWGPVVWVLLGEMFNNKIRAAALSVAAAIQWVANFVMPALILQTLSGTSNNK